MALSDSGLNQSRQIDHVYLLQGQGTQNNPYLSIPRDRPPPFLSPRHGPSNNWFVQQSADLPDTSREAICMDERQMRVEVNLVCVNIGP